MKSNVMTRKWIVLLMALAMLLNVGFAAGEAQPQEEELFGSPWINSSVIGNVLPEKPEAKDDLFQSANYETILAHQETYLPLYEAGAAIQGAVLSMIGDETAADPEMQAMRTMFTQASDDEGLSRTGWTEADAYVEKILAASTLEELNSALLAEDFPFSPYILMMAMPESMRKNNVIYLMPALAMADDPMGGMIEYYDAEATDSDQFYQKMMQLNQGLNSFVVLNHMGKGEDNTALLAAEMELYNMEMSYIGKIPKTKAILSEAYGYAAESHKYLTAEELDALCPSFPLTATLKKFGKDASSVYSVDNPEWISALNDLWKEENLDKLKTLTAWKVLTECSPYMTQEPFNFIRNGMQQATLSGTENGWSVVSHNQVFSPLIAKLYAEKVLGSEVKDQLTEMTKGLIEVYRQICTETEWICEETRVNALEKLDNMTLNILEPKDGYIDFSGLQLKSSEEGGTLLGNYLAIKKYRNDLENAMIGQPATADMAWRETSPAVTNAFYDPLTNSINIMPVFINGLNWWDGITEMEILGGLGTVIGHEMSHGFDFYGSQFNAYGEPTPILADDDVEDFVNRADQIVAYYDGLTVLPGIPTPGNNLKMENAADLMGLKAAAILAASKENADMKAFFEMFAKLYAQVTDLNMAEMIMQIDTHAPNILRVNVNAQMTPEFYEAFGVQEGDGMYVKPEDRLVVWGK
ncbi:MAG: M13 family metallopeptidase [Clostridia bacterium]|nr:M13 family metallopeptidase [Clostridia bacterium]